MVSTKSSTNIAIFTWIGDTSCDAILKYLSAFLKAVFYDEDTSGCKLSQRDDAFWRLCETKNKYRMKSK